MSPDELASWSQERRQCVDAVLLEQFRDAEPPRMREALRYPLETGGKRIRPLLAFASAEAVGGDPTMVSQAAAAVELVHTYSLVHDDLPCMDDDDERRGKPTVHKVFGDAMAVLVGDALLTQAFGLMASHPALGATLVKELSERAGYGGMVGGQADEFCLEQANEDALISLHRRKTGALIVCAVRCGARLGGATDAQLASLTLYAEAVGLAFQLADDLLDFDQDAARAEGAMNLGLLLGQAETLRRSEALLDAALGHIGALPAPGPLAALARFSVHRSH